jgi:hypothetical protein
MCTVAQHRLSHLERSRCPVFEAENAHEALQVLELSKAFPPSVHLEVLPRLLHRGHSQSRLPEAWQHQLSPRLVVTVYAGRAFGRDVIRSIYPDGPNGAYGYVELVRRF